MSELPIGVALSGEVAVEFQKPVEILERPQDVWVRRGGSALLGVKASGSVVRYQWKKGSTAIVGAVSSQLALDAVEEAQAGAYSVVVSNGVSSVEVGAVVRMAGLPVIRNVPSVRRVAQGSALDLRADAVGDGVMSYQWYRNGVVVTGATGATYTVSGLSSAKAGMYTVKVSNSAGSVTSEAAEVKLVGVPVLVSGLPGLTVVSGGVLRMTVGLTADVALSGVWKKDGVTISGASGASYTIGSMKAVDAGVYTVKVSNEVKSVSSAGASVSAFMIPVVTQSPVGGQVTYGGTYTLSVVASGGAPLSYQWLKEGVAMSGKTASTLAIANAVDANTGNYSVRVTNAAGSVTSGAVNVLVKLLPPVIVKQPVDVKVGYKGSVTLSVVVILRI